MAAEPQPAVEFTDVMHRYAGRPALEQVSLMCETGSAAAVVGPDGVGKSTLLGLIAGVRRLQSGSLRVLGGDMRSAGHRKRISHHIAYMPQVLGRNLYPSLSVVENLDFFGRLFGVNETERRARVDIPRQIPAAFNGLRIGGGLSSETRSYPAVVDLDPAYPHVEIFLGHGLVQPLRPTALV